MKNKQKCPHCGCQIYDPFAGTTRVHDVEKCGAIKKIKIISK